ncbi:MAG: type II toxin-antitoxin system VapC family toxin [bacterium]|nr:type II toxin-antitoxin system VapC family toxin [bacterium]
MERERVLIDTSILIDHLRKQKKERTLFYQLSTYCEFVISSITEFEFRIGATPKNREFMQSLLAVLPVLTFDSGCVNTATELYQGLKAKNKLIALPDLFIAATALNHDIELLTLNRKHFKRIHQLKLHPKST